LVCEDFVIILIRIIASETDKLRKDWLNVINNSRNTILETKKNLNEPNNDNGKLQKKFKENKAINFLRQVVKSGVGKLILKTFVSQDGMNLISVITQIITQHIDSNTGTFYENFILELAVYIVYLIKDKIITKEEVLLTRDSIFKLWSNALDMLELSFAFDEDELINILQASYQTVGEIIFPYMNDTETESFQNLFRILINKELILLLYKNDEYLKNRENLHTILRKVWDESFSFTYN